MPDDTTPVQAQDPNNSIVQDPGLAQILQTPTQNPQLAQAPPPQPQPKAQAPTVGRPILLDLISGLAHPQVSQQTGRPVSRLSVFENFLGNFLNAFSQGMAGEGHGPGAAMRGAGIAMQAPYQQQVQQFQMQQQANAQQAQNQEAQGRAQLYGAQADQMRNGQMVMGPNGQPIWIPNKDMGKIGAGVVANQGKANVAGIQAASRMSVEQMKMNVAAGKVARVEPAKDADGNTVMRAYNTFGKVLGDMDGAIPPTSYLPKTSFTQNADGSYSSRTSAPVLPGGAGKPAPSPSRIPSKPSAGGGAKLSPIQSQAQDVVEGRMDPSQVSKRTFALVSQAANEYSQQKYGQPFDFAKAASDYKYSSDKSTQNTLKYLNSLTGNPVTGTKGNLDLLIDKSNKISRTDFPALNDAAAWARLESGDPGIVEFHNVAVDVADQFAKIMAGGGTGNATSDGKIKQGLEMFRTGFSKEQVIGSTTSVNEMLTNRKREMIGDNRYLLRQYGGGAASSNSPAKATHRFNVSTGKIEAIQ